MPRNGVTEQPRSSGLGKLSLEFALNGRLHRLGIARRLIVVDNDACRSKLAHSVALFLLRPAFPALRRTSRAAAIGTYPGLRAWAILLGHFMASACL